jgi:hypothetical protein
VKAPEDCPTESYLALVNGSPVEDEALLELPQSLVQDIGALLNRVR